ncbi:uncharacterized protein CBL_13507 [Carabus blaptoides fortunei]
MVYNNVACSVIPTRAGIGAMVFTACLFSYMLRVNMSINLIAMVQPRQDSANGSVSVPECLIVNNVTIDHSKNIIPDYGVRYNWDQQTQGLILGAYFWGYILTSIPGGLLAERWGPRMVVGIASFLSGVLTIITPVAATVHYDLVITIRFLTGFLGGVLYPALHCLISRWAPPTEKGKFAGALMGGTFGTVITWPILGVVSEQWGWVWAFYLPGILCISWAVLWFIVVSDSPQEHKRISEDEKNYIIKSLGNYITKTKKIPPYKQIFTSVPFWALIILHYGNLWGLYFLLTAGPKFMSEVLGFNLAHSGGLASLPYLARMTFGFIFGSIGDTIRRKEWLTVTGIRKWFVVCSNFIPGLFLLGQILAGCNVVAAVVIITLSLGFNGASTITNIQNSQDLAPNYAGTLYGIVNCIGGTTGFITPILTGYITRDHNGMAEWRIIFTIGASVYILSGIVFCIFGTGEMQPWNNITEDEVKKEGKGHENHAFEQSETTHVKKADNGIQPDVTEITKV